MEARPFWHVLHAAFLMDRDGESSQKNMQRHRQQFSRAECYDTGTKSCACLGSVGSCTYMQRHHLMVVTETEQENERGPLHARCATWWTPSATRGAAGL